MTISMEEAIKTAIDYEKKIRDIYMEASEKTSEPEGKLFFKTMGDDEQGHIDYLEERLEGWMKTGELSVEKLDSIVPSSQAIAEQAKKIETRVQGGDRKDEKAILNKALKAEIETTGFYKKLVDEMSGEAQGMFAQFLKIEDDHISAVQAELDYIIGTGYWLGFKEFGMEGI
ncbi:MAG: ferritin family protein [Desulfobacterales bacterium]|nr:ferritin family protein [Desulfobacterales bacterium]